MCRSIQTLRGAEPPAGRAEAEAASLQYVRKVSGFRSPSAANREAFEAATREIAETTLRLLGALEQNAASRRSRSTAP